MYQIINKIIRDITIPEFIWINLLMIEWKAYDEKKHYVK